MTITLYRSDDASAPTLTGQVGSLTNLLDAVLVNGYGAKSAAGWAIAFTGTNQRAYRAASGNRRYLQVDDNNTLAAGANYARTVGYESMSAITTGTAPVPTAVQISGGLNVQKSQTADSVQRAWWAVASGTFFYLCCESNTPVASTPTAATYFDCYLLFGDFTSKVPSSGDAYNTLHATFQSGTTVTTTNSLMSQYLNSTWLGNNGCYTFRPYTQLGSSAQSNKMVARRSGSSTPAGFGNDAAAPNFPDPITGGMNFAETYVAENGGANTVLTRGLLPGFYDIVHNPTSLASSFTPLDTIAGAGAFAGITFMLLKLPYGPGNTIAWYAALQITGTWP